MRVRNISDQAQHFTSIGTFEPGEVREVDEAQGEYLLHSPFIRLAEQSKSEQRRTKSMRGVEAE